MTIRLPFMDRIKLLTRNLINGKSIDLNRPRSYEVKILPSSAQRGRPQSPLSSAHAIKPAATVAAPWVFARANRLSSVNQRSGRDVEHTRSNLG